MKIRETSVYSRALAIFLAVSLLLLGAVVVLTQGVIMREFTETERREMAATLRLAGMVLDREVYPMASLIEQWAATGDFSQFLPGDSSRNAAFVAMVNGKPEVDFLALYARDGRIVEMAPGTDGGPTDAAALKTLLMENGLTTAHLPEAPRAGFVVNDGRLGVLCEVPVRMPDGTVGGFVIGGRMLSGKFWSYFGRLFSANVNFQTFATARVAKVRDAEVANLFDKGTPLIRFVEPDEIVGQTLIAGIQGAPVGVLTFTQSRALRREAVHASRVFLIGVTLAGGVLVLILWAVLDRTILNRIKDLTRKLKTGNRAGGLPVRLDFHGNDELGTLARGIEDLALRLENTQSQYRAVVEDQTEMICRFDADLRIAFANRIFIEMFKIEGEPVSLHRLDAFLPEAARKVFVRQFSRLTPEKPLVTLVHEISMRSGHPLWVRSTLRANFGTDRRCRGGQWVMADVTAQVEAQRQLRQLSAKLLRLQDEERRRIARELHDSTAQNLSALEMNMSLLEPLLADASPRAARLVADTRQIASECSRELRNVSYLLHPPLIDEVGLAFAVKWFADGFAERTGIKVTVEIGNDFPRLDSDVEMALFRVVQEAMTNIYRHSGAHHAWIRLHRDGGDAILEIRDDGCGFEAGGEPGDGGELPGRKSGVGLAGIRERLGDFGGTLRLDNSPGGVTVTITFSLNETRST